MSEIEQKPWGTAEHVYRERDGQVTVIRVRKGGFSSIHLHEHKANAFTVLSGSMDVRLYNEQLELRSTVRLDASHAQRTYTVPAGFRHAFSCSKDTVAVESYYSDDPRGRPVRPDDIVRFTENGIALSFV